MASLPACRLDLDRAKKTPMYSSGLVSGVAAEVLEQDQRRATLAAAGVAVRVVDAVGRADQLVLQA
jgi:hypothetical protein